MPADDLKFRHAIDDANRWRGRMVNLFARGELIIAQRLQAGPNAKPLPLLTSQRITRLTTLVEGNKRQSDALRIFGDLAKDRNSIVHGSGKIHLDRDGKWLLTLELIDRNGTITSAVSQADTEKRDQELKTAVDRLAAAFCA